MARRLLLAAILLLPLAAMAQQQITIQSEQIKGELDFPTLTIYGSRQTPEFPKMSLDLRPGDLLTRVPKSMIPTESVERVPTMVAGEDLTKTVAK